MIDQLITAYRAEIYGWNKTQWKAFLKTSWKRMSAFFLGILIPLGLYILGAAIESAILMLFSLLAEAIPLVLLDRYLVKNHKISLQNRCNHIKKTEAFLKEAIPGISLFKPEIIDVLIQRLSDRIDEKMPFRSFVNNVKHFAESIIIPVLTYLAGIYSASLKTVSIEVVATYAIFIVLFLGVIRLAWAGFTYFVRTVFFKEYNAAVALKEDLLDLQLLYLEAQIE